MRYTGLARGVGGSVVPPERGPYSTDFLQQLLDDAPDLPMWLDPENSSNAAAADRVPTETFAFMPDWLGLGYWLRGGRGYWDPDMTGNIAQQVIAHTHYIDTHANTAMAKRVVPMSLHRYNWDLPRQANGNQPFFACQGLGADCSKLKVLAFSPSVEKLLASSASWHEFTFLLQGLAALATALGRAVAWPSLPCNTSWVSRGRSVERPPLRLGGMWLPWSSPEGDLMCTPWPYVNDECLSRGRGMLPWEYNHMHSQQHSESDSHSSIIHAEHDREEEDHVREGHFALANHVVAINATTEADSLQPMQDRAILLLDSFVHVVFSEAPSQQKQAYNRFWQECTVLDTAAYTAIFDHDGNRVPSIPTAFSTKPMADFGLSHRPARLRRGRLHRHDHSVIKA
ncbi:hypothetical protein ABBQ32_012690 [Trebouxia sp. C0010 RCD-2024]